MSSYLSSWWYGSSTRNLTDSESDLTQQVTPRLTIIQPDTEDPADKDHGPEEHDDSPPAFPSFDSIQRSRPGRSRKGEKKPDTMQMPPPSIIPGLKPDLPSSGASLRVPSSSLRPPPTTTRPPPAPSKAKRGKVMLAPGHSPLDWAALKASGKDLRGTSGLLRVTPLALRQHKAVDDAWTAINGRVYNITPYLDYHPGGVKELMRVAGRDGSTLFASTHAWVNVEFMLDECLVGFLVPDKRVASSDSE